MSANKLSTAQEYIRSNYIGTGRLRYDLLSQKLQICTSSPDSEKTTQKGQTPLCSFGVGLWQDLDTRWINTMAVECANETGVSVSDKEIRIVLNSHIVPAINPLRDWLQSLPEYTPGKQSFIDWLSGQVKIKSPARPTGYYADSAAMANNHPSLLNAPTNGGATQPNLTTIGNPVGSQWDDSVRLSSISQDRFKECFRKWFVAMVASWMYDEVVNQQVLVLIGKQGIYKTTWLEHLMPPCLRAYCTKMANVRDLNKDERMRIAEFGLINLDEIDSMSDKELNQLKSIITSADVNERAAYGYTKERRIRIASFCASGNKREFLTDQTGNRRWLPFEVESIDSPYNWGNSFPYEQIYAEALYLINHGFEYWFELPDIEAMESHVESFHVESNEEQLLPVYFQPANPGDNGAVFMSAAEISSLLVSYGNIRKPLALNKLSSVLQRAGFVARKANGRRGFVMLQLLDLDNQRKINARNADSESRDDRDGRDDTF